MKTKVCTKCGKRKSLDNYNWLNKSKGWKHAECKVCHTKRAQTYYRKNQEKIKQKVRDYRKTEKGKKATKEFNLQRKYRLSFAERETMYKEQKGVCPICGNFILNKDMQVDHDHNTEQVRDLLCHKCNTLVGYLEFYSDLLEPSFKYLEKWSKNASY